jgi:hypothetical protein
MHKINLFFIMLFLLITPPLWAKPVEQKLQTLSYSNKFLNIKINYEPEVSLSQIQNIMTIVQKGTLNPYILNNLDSLAVEININKKSKRISLSNADKNCKVNLNYEPNLNGVLINPFEEDLLFTYFHEISHCLLGKELFKTGLKWDNALKLTEEQITQRNDKIDTLTDQSTIQEQCNTNCIAINVFKKPPPLVVYHEMFADTMGIYFYQQYDCKIATKIFSEIENLRFDKYVKDKVKNMHQSFRAFNYISFREFCNKPIDFKKISFYTQQGFLDYLDGLE